MRKPRSHISFITHLHMQGPVRSYGARVCIMGKTIEGLTSAGSRRFEEETGAFLRLAVVPGSGSAHRHIQYPVSLIRGACDGYPFEPRLRPGAQACYRSGARPQGLRSSVAAAPPPIVPSGDSSQGYKTFSNALNSRQQVLELEDQSRYAIWKIGQCRPFRSLIFYFLKNISPLAGSSIRTQDMGVNVTFPTSDGRLQC